MVGVSNTVNPALYDKLSFDFVRDIAPVGGVVRAPFVLVVALSVPARTLPEFIAYTKANPGKVNMASSGSGAGSHMTGELFKMMAGVDMQHVPYRGGGPALLDLIAEQVQVYFAGMPESIGYIRAGKIRPLAVTSTTRAQALPDLPTIAEFIPGYESNLWFGVGAPSRTPAGIIDKLNQEINAGLADAKVKARYAELGSTVFPTSPGDFGKLFVEETEKWAKVVKFAGVKPE
jgi:tripartite-type tricarboxylate transporter receptor subunit TctC